MLTERGWLLRIHVGEAMKHEGKPLYEWLVTKAKNQGLAGATVLRGMAGFGSHHQIRTAKILDISTDLPIIIEIIDTQEKLEAFMPFVDESVTEGLATMEQIYWRFYRKSAQ